MTHRYLKGNFFLLKLDYLPTLQQFMNYCDTKGIFHKDINFIIFFIPIKYFKIGYVVGILLFSYNLLFLFSTIEFFVDE